MSDRIEPLFDSPDDHAAALRQFVREHRARLAESDSVAARRYIRDRYPIEDAERQVADDQANDDDWMFDPQWEPCDDE